MRLVAALERFFQESLPFEPGDRVVVAFSGGPDSTALLWGMSRLAAGGPPELFAAHLDHGMDPGSAGRADAAARLARSLGVPLRTERREVGGLARPGEGLEAAARRVRYEFLDEVRRDLGARWVLTAHHRDDQAETVALRLLFGTGLEGLAGVRPIHGRVVRPLLDLPRSELRRAAAEATAGTGVAPVEDPTNLDLATPRNRVRHWLLPALAVAEPDVAERLARLAAAARRAGGAIDAVLRSRLHVLEAPDGGALAVDRRDVERLPPALRPFALAWLHRRAGAPYPAGRAAAGELLRQLARGGRVGCDCGGGWRWDEEPGGRLRLARRRAPRQDVFTYTLVIPGEIEIPELSAKVALSRDAVSPWMFRGSHRRVGLALPLAPGDRVTIRSRRPGDRLRPLGAAGSRRLKEVLIDRGVPREERDRLPLLCVGERIAWVPGVTIDDRFRLAGAAESPGTDRPANKPANKPDIAWIAEITTT